MIQLDVQVKMKNALRLLGERAVSEMLNAAMVDGAVILAEEAQVRAPVDTGALRRSIHIAGHTDRTPGFKGAELQKPSSLLEVKVGTLCPYAVVQEYGCGPIYPKRAKALTWIDKRTGERVFAMSTRGVPPHPYMRPALDVRGEAALRRIATSFRDRVYDKVARG